MTNSNTNLTILSTTIRRDAEGRYSLSDCWKVSGKDAKNKPSEWFSAAKTQEFLRALEGERKSPPTPVSLVTTGPNEGRGYWADRKAVIHYATWISPDFYLTVISAFDALVTGQIPNTESKPKRIRKTPVLRAFRDGYGIAKTLGLDDNQAASHAGRYCLHKCGENPLPALGLDAQPAPTQDNYQTVTELGRPLGLSGQRVNKILEERGLQVHVKGSSSSSNWSMTDKGLAYGRMFDGVRVGSTGSQQMLKWKPSTVEFLRPFAKVPA
ncbi:KilA-N domain-containing protein [Acetobacter okinawensis]|uniref:KilA-N domain-containing protein n=1 Tax=Acetobacter okinawensis TaxID=1076594 RepID=UPI0039EA05F3